MNRSRILSLVILLGLLLTLFPTSAGAVSLTDPKIGGMTSFVFNGTSVTVTDGTDTNYEIVVYHADDTETDPKTATSGDSVTYSVPEGDDGELSVAIKKAGGAYVFSGNGKGNITVKKGATGTAYLHLNGLTLSSSFTSVITVNKDSSTTCSIYTMNNTVNTLTDAAQNNSDLYPDNAAAESAVIKAKASSNVWILGNGTLNINGNAKNGIKGNGKLTIAGNVQLNVNAVDNGISGEDTVTVYSGNIDVTTHEGDGIKCGADDTPTGDIVIHGGTFTIDAYADGIQATANLTIHGGVFNITCFGGYTSTYDGDSDAYPSAKGLKASGSYTDANGAETDATECYLTINGGYFLINSPDDAIHSDKDVAVTAGVLDLYSADDGIHSEYANVIGKQNADNNDLYITIHKCYEGIEGANIAIHSGIINIFASDDSINAANSDLGNNYAFSVDITGGIIYCASLSGDCLDSNRDFTISGGTLVVLGSITQQDNTAVDTDGTFAIQGGEILTIGNSGMLKNPTTTQNYCSWTATGSATASTGGTSGGGSSSIGRPGRPGQGGMPGGGSSGGSVVGNNKQLTITDASGKTLISVAIQWDGNPSGSASYVLYSNASLTSGSSYTLTVGTVQTVSGGSNITSHEVSKQPQTPATDESATPAIPSEIIASDTINTDNEPTPPTVTILYGDVDNDNTVSAADALEVLKSVVGNVTLTPNQMIAADVDGNGTTSSSDALYILKWVVGKIDVFPAQQ
ncbi:MAG: carbohydrate-binding domain-containing protein [Clostridia bacterium]|nr:carbohydrate-binding domain-containing protein [Clostridia bacterium]